MANRVNPAASKVLKTISFDDTDKLFASISTSRLLRVAMNPHMVAVELMMDVGMRVMRSRLMHTPLIKDVMVLNEAGLRGMLVYTLEYAGNNETCDRNLQGFLDTAESTKSLPPSSASCIIVPLLKLL
ncbi:hypothetical protein ACFX2B_027189 [Malus domestica]